MIERFGHILTYKILLAAGRITSSLAGHSIDLAKWQEINEIFLNFKLIQATPSTRENESQNHKFFRKCLIGVIHLIFKKRLVEQFMAGHSNDLVKLQEINEIFLNFKLIQLDMNTKNSINSFN